MGWSIGGGEGGATRSNTVGTPDGIFFQKY